MSASTSSVCATGLLDSCTSWTRDPQRLEQHPSHASHVAHRRVECLLIGLRRRVKTADLADELQRGVVQLVVGWRVIGVPQAFDVPTHVNAALSRSLCGRPVKLRADAPWRNGREQPSRQAAPSRADQFGSQTATPTRESAVPEYRYQRPWNGTSPSTKVVPAGYWPVRS